MKDLDEEFFDPNEWATTSYATIIFESTSDPNKLYVEKLKNIIKEKPNLSSNEILFILTDLFYFINIQNNNRIFPYVSEKIQTKVNNSTKQDPEIIIKYFYDIFNIYKEKIKPIDLVDLCMDISDKEISEKIIRKNYKKLRKEIRKSLYCQSSYDCKDLDIWEINTFNIPEAYKAKNYTAKRGEIASDNIITFYKYFGNDIKFLNNDFTKFYKYDYSNIQHVDIDTIFYFFQIELKNKNYKEAFKLLKYLQNYDYKEKELTNILTEIEWIKIFKSKNFLEKLLSSSITSPFISKISIEENFANKLWNLIYRQKKVKKTNIRNIYSIYDYKFYDALKILSIENYNDNKKNYLFLECFKAFLKEFLKKYEDKITQKDLELLEIIFRRIIQRGDLFKIFQINNRKNLIHNYKSNDILVDTDIDINYIKNYNVKQYRILKEKLLKKSYSNRKNLLEIPKINYDKYIILSLNIFGYDITKKLIEFNPQTWILIIDMVKNKPQDFVDKMKIFIKHTDSTAEISKNYSSTEYLSVLEKLIESKNNKKITINNINKILQSVKNLLVPYNIELTENLELLNHVVKGEPFLEKLKGIKLYEIYRKRLTSTIPDCNGTYNNLKYGLLNLHDKSIISNGINNYLLPNNCKASSCLTPNGKAKTCLEHGAINPNGRFFKITNNKNIVTYSWVWRCGDVLCFDNIEVTDEIQNIENYEKKIYEIYLKAAKDIVQKTKIEKSKGIKLVLIGRNKIDVKNKYIDNLKSLNELNGQLFKPNSKTELYLKDSSENQLILYGDYNKSLSTNDVEPSYIYERQKVYSFDELNKKNLKAKINGIYYEYCLQNCLKYHKLNPNYKSGYIGEDWFIGNKIDGSYDFYYTDNDERLFKEAKKYTLPTQKLTKKEMNIYIPKVEVNNILDSKNIIVDKEAINDYLNQLNNHDYEIPNTYFSHTTKSIETLNNIIKTGAITSAFYGNRDNAGGRNGKYYISVAQINSYTHNSYKKTGTIILDNNMEILNDNDLITPQKINLAFENTSYPLRIGLGEGEGQVLKQISLEHFNSFLAMKNEQIKLAQLILLNKIYNLNLPIILESTMSKIDTDIIKKHIKIRK